MKNIFKRQQREQDWSLYFGKVEPSKKRRLIQFAEKKNISIYLDDSGENSSGVYAVFRGVASEVELEKRINDYKKLYWQKVGTTFAIICSLCGGLVWLASKLMWI